MIEQNTNPTNKYYNNPIIEENQNSDFKPTSQLKMVYNNQENRNITQGGSTSGDGSYNSSSNIFEWEKSFHRKELLSTHDEKNIDKKVELEIDESQDYDIEYVNKSPVILEKHEKMEEKEPRNDPQTDREDRSEEVNIISALNEKERNEDVDKQTSIIAEEPDSLKKQKDLPLKEEDEDDDVNIISALNKKERNK